MDDHDELAQTLLDDDQPSWVTLSQEEYDVGNNDISGLNGGGGGGEARSSASAWDRNNNNNISGKQNRRRKDSNELPKFIPLLRLGNMGAALLLIYGSMGNLAYIFSPSKMVLGGYGICFGILLCCLESNLSFVRHPLASNFGFLYSPFLRFIFYILLGMISYSFESIVGTTAAVALCVLSLVNTVVLCRYPGYGAAIQELCDAEERNMRRVVREQMFRNATSIPWWEV